MTDEALLANFQAFLDANVVTRIDSTDAFVARPERCELDAIIPDTDYLLAAGKALTVRRRGPDSATVRAEIVSVGNLHYSDGPLGVRAEVDVRTARIEWEMLRDAEGDWGPCGYASTRRDFGRMGDAARDIHWTPRGAGWATIARLSDSVRRARYLPVP